MDPDYSGHLHPRSHKDDLSHYFVGRAYASSKEAEDIGKREGEGGLLDV